ncbi:MAG: type II secretion system F family protein [Clostridia bacterium]
MPEYMYRAITKEGVIVKNKVESPSKQNLIKKLKAGNLLPIDIVQVGYGLNKKKVTTKKNVTDIDELMKTANSSNIVQARERKKQTVVEKINLAISKQEKITTRDIMVFTQNFYLLKKADFNNIHALSTIIQSTENISFRGILEDILAGVESGEYMYTTMEYYSNVFPYIYINMIKVGELSGSLTQSLQQAIKYLDSNTDTIKKLKGIIIPNVIQLVALLILLFVGSLYTVPTIQNVYDEVGSTDTLPEITIIFSNVMQWIADNWYVPVGIIVIIVAVILAYINTPKGKYNFDYFKYTMPIFGKLIYSLDFSRLMRAMLLNLENGMRIQDALEVSKNVVNNYVMRAMVETSINNILTGASWIEPFEKSGLSSSMITEMLKVGMQTDLSEMMHKLLDYMDIDIKNTMDKIMAVLPQVVYSIVGVLLIFVVIVVLVPCIQVYMGNFLFSAAGV